MAITLKTAGSWAESTSASTLVAMPGTPANGDRYFAFSSWKDFSITATMPAGWTEITEFADGSTATGNGTGSMKVACWWRAWATGDTWHTTDASHTITYSTATGLLSQNVAQLWQKAGGDTWDPPLFQTAAWPSQAGPASVAASSAAVDINDGAAVMCLLGIRDDSAAVTSLITDITDAGVTFNGAMVKSPANVKSTTTGNDMSADLAYRYVTTGAAAQTLNMAATLAAAETGAVLWVVQNPFVAPARTAALTGAGILAPTAVAVGANYNTTGAGNTSSNSTTVSTTHTCTGSNRAVLVAVSCGVSSDTRSSYTCTVTYAGSPMTLLATRAVGDSVWGWVDIWGMLAPPTGAQTVAVQYKRTSDNAAPVSLIVDSVSFTEANSFGTPVTNASNALTVAATVSSATQRQILAAAAHGITITSISNTQRVIHNLNTATGAGNQVVGTAAGAASVTFTASSGSSDLWGIVVVDVQSTITAAFAGSGHGVLSATTTAKYARTAGFAGVGLFAPLARMYRIASPAVLSGHGVLAATADAVATNPERSAVFTGYGALTATAVPKFARTSAFTGVGVLSATATMYRIASAATLPGHGTLTATAVAKYGRTAAFTGTGLLTSLARMYKIAAPATLSGHGTLAATATAKYARTGGFAGTGALSSLARMYRIASVVALPGHGTLAAAATAKYARTVAFTGHGVLAATASTLLPANTFLLDYFTDTDAALLQNHTADSGATWAKQTGWTENFVVQSNRIFAGNSQEAHYYASAVPTGPNYTVSVDINVVSLSAFTLAGAMARMATGANTGYAAFVIWNGSVTAVYLKKFVAGTGTDLGNFVITNPTVGSTHNLTLRIMNNQLSALWDGSTVLGPLTTTDITAAGRAGVQHNGVATSSTGFHIESVIATELVSAPAFAGRGTLSATVQGGTPTRTPSFTGAGALTAIARAKFTRIAAFTGTGVLTTAVVTKHPRTAGFTGIGTLTAVARAKFAKTAALTGTGALTATARMYRIASTATLTGAGQLIATAIPRAIRTAIFTGSGALTATARMYRIAKAVAFNGAGQLSATTKAKFARSATLAGSGQLTATARMYRIAKAVAFTGAGTLSALTESGYNRQANPTGKGTLSATTKAKFTRTTTLSGAGQLSAVATARIATTTTLSGHGQLTPQAQMYRISKAVAFGGAGLLQATAFQAGGRTATFAGSGQLTAQARMYRISKAVAFGGAGTLNASRIPRQSRTAAFAGTGALSAQARMYKIACSAALFGAGHLSATTRLEGVFEIDAVLTGSGTLSPRALKRWSTTSYTMVVAPTSSGFRLARAP